jgi:peptide deformylase
MIYEILKYPDKRLTIKAVDVADHEFGTSELSTIVSNMFDTMYEYEGIGLAATQVDIHKKIIVMEIKTARYIIINPEIMQQSESLEGTREGCLSVPEVYGEVVRPEAVTIQYKNIQGDSLTLEAKGLLATCIQHEIDHLNGIVYVDRMKGLKKNMLLKKYEKLNKY